jgi:DNA polymerase elongation subunit (family B)
MQRNEDNAFFSMFSEAKHGGHSDDESDNDNDNTEETPLFSSSGDAEPIHETSSGYTLKDRPEDHKETVVIGRSDFYEGDESWGTLGMRPDIGFFQHDPQYSSSSSSPSLSPPSLFDLSHKRPFQITHIDLRDEMPPSRAHISDAPVFVPNYDEDMEGVNQLDFASPMVHKIQGASLNALMNHKSSSAPCSFEGFRKLEFDDRMDHEKQLSELSDEGPGMHVVLFARSMDAHSMCVVCHGFRPWFHVNIPMFVKIERMEVLLCALGQQRSHSQAELRPGIDIRVTEDTAYSIYGWYSDTKDVRERRSFQWARIETRSNRLRKLLVNRLSAVPPSADTDEEQVADLYPGFRNSPQLWREYVTLHTHLCQSAPLCRKAVNGHTPYLRRGDVHWCSVHDYSEHKDPEYTVQKRHQKKQVYHVENNAYITLDEPPKPFFANHYAEPIVQFLYQRDIAVNSFVYLDEAVDVVDEQADEEDRITLCQYEGYIHHTALRRYPQEETMTMPAPLVTLSFDGEMIPQYDRFPESFLGDETRVISVTLGRSDKGAKDSVDVLLVVGDVGVTREMYDDPQTIVRCYESAPKALHGLQKLITDVDADILTGYNTFGFDCPYWNNEYVQHISPQRLRGTEAMHCFFLYSFPRLKALWDILSTTDVISKEGNSGSGSGSGGTAESATKTTNGNASTHTDNNGNHITDLFLSILQEDLPYTHEWFTHEHAFGARIRLLLSQGKKKKTGEHFSSSTAPKELTGRKRQRYDTENSKGAKEIKSSLSSPSQPRVRQARKRSRPSSNDETQYAHTSNSEVPLSLQREEKEDYFQMSVLIFRGLEKRFGRDIAMKFARHPCVRQAPLWDELIQDTVFFLWSIFVIAFPEWENNRSSESFGHVFSNAPAHEKVSKQLDTIVQQVCGAEIWTNALMRNKGSPIRIPMIHAVFLRRLLRNMIESKMETLRSVIEKHDKGYTVPYSLPQVQKRKKTWSRLRKCFYQRNHRHQDAPHSSNESAKAEYPAWNQPSRVKKTCFDDSLDVGEEDEKSSTLFTSDQTRWNSSHVPPEDVRLLSSDTWWHNVFSKELRSAYVQWTDRYVNTLEASPMVGHTTISACFRWPVLYDPQNLGTNSYGASELPFFCKGRYVASFQPYIELKSMSSQATGEVYLNMWEIHGRIQFDLLQWVRANKKLDSYSLKRVTQEFFGKHDQEDLIKDDLGYREMFERIRHADPRKRAAVLTYARQDARVCARLLEHSHIPLQLGSLARLTNVPMRHIYNYGQQKRVLSQMTRRGYELGFCMTTGFSEYPIYFGDTPYKGACVVQPKPDVYTSPVLTLDFASLYPTTMESENFDFSNFIQPSRVDHLYKRGLPIRVYPLEPKQSEKKTHEEKRKRRMMASHMDASFVDHHALHALRLIRRYNITAETTIQEMDEWAKAAMGEQKNQHNVEKGEERNEEKCSDNNRGCGGSSSSSSPSTYPSIKPEDIEFLRANPDVDDLSLPFMSPGYLWCTIDILHSSIGQILIRRIKKSPNKQFYGVTPVMLDEYLRERKSVKKSMKKAGEEGNHTEEEVLNKKQLAIKAGANSIYGFMGSVTHALACKAMAAAITAAGRAALQVLFDYLAIKYPDIVIVYGDTDSIMIYRTDKKQTVEEAFAFGMELADELTRRCFGHPMVLEFEKIYCPYILFPHPKRYAGHKFENPKDPTEYKVEHKGTPNIKRNHPNLIRNVYGDLINLILGQHGNVTAQMVFDTAKAYIDKLANNQCTMEDLQTSVSLNNNVTALTPGAKAWEKMKKRQDPDTPQSGDRLTYAHVYHKSFKKNDMRVSDNTESVTYIQRMNLPLDNIYYLEQVRKKMDDVVVSMDPKGTSQVRLHSDEKNASHTLQSALEKYIAQAKEKFQRIIDSRSIRFATSSSGESPHAGLWKQIPHVSGHSVSSFSSSLSETTPENTVTSSSLSSSSSSSSSSCRVNSLFDLLETKCKEKKMKQTMKKR